MILEYVRLPLGAALVDLVAILAVIVLVVLHDGHIELGHRVGMNLRMSLGHVVDQHATSFEAEQTLVAFVDEVVIVGGRNL